MAEKKAEDVEAVPDPDEDDLDDLDDVLDEFDSKPKVTEPKPTSPAPTASGPGRPKDDATTTDPLERAPSGDANFDQLQAGMESLMSELGSDPDMQKKFEDMMQELIAAGAASTDGEALEHIQSAGEKIPQDPDEGKKGEDKFQDTIRKTMERMQASGDAATAASTSSGEQSEEAMLMEMMKSLGGSEGLGLGGEEDFNKMLMSMMTQLTNKEILYEPMKELHDKFPAWLEANAGKTKAEDLERYKEQQRLVDEIVARFEKEGYSDEKEADRDFIVERMSKMQAQGSPPPDLVGDMSSAQEALGDLDAGCPTQ